VKQIHAEALYVALDHRRRHDGLTFEHIAQEIGFSRSAISRLGRGTTPTANVFVRTVLWLGADFGEFVQDAPGADA
jgi:transcriptional regulator with XRE-family HTH domain